MSELSNDKRRLAIGVVLILSAIATFIYGLLERSAGKDFNEIWMLAIVMFLGASVHLQKIGKRQKKNQKKKA